MFYVIENDNNTWTKTFHQQQKTWNTYKCNGLGCKNKANCPHVRPGPMGENAVLVR